MGIVKTFRSLTIGTKGGKAGGGGGIQPIGGNDEDDGSVSNTLRKTVSSFTESSPLRTPGAHGGKNAIEGGGGGGGSGGSATPGTPKEVFPKEGTAPKESLSKEAAAKDMVHKEAVSSRGDGNGKGLLVEKDSWKSLDDVSPVPPKVKASSNAEGSPGAESMAFELYDFNHDDLDDGEEPAVVHLPKLPKATKKRTKKRPPPLQREKSGEIDLQGAAVRLPSDLAAKPKTSSKKKISAPKLIVPVEDSNFMAGETDMSIHSIEAADYMIDSEVEPSYGIVPNSTTNLSYHRNAEKQGKRGMKTALNLIVESDNEDGRDRENGGCCGFDLEIKPTVENDFVLATETFGDGSFHSGGFKITKSGIVQTPGMNRVNSQGEILDGVPPSTTNIIYVKAFRDIEYLGSIGAGASGQVRLAVHRPSRSRLAVKIVNVYDEELRKQLLMELATLSTYVSRFLVRFYGAFYDAGTVHVVLEYMDSGSLDEAIKIGGKVPENVTRQIAKHCLHGLSFLHSNNVLHRDFKSANILLSRRLNRSKLSDFGLAKELGGEVSQAATFVGTLAYMSPERLKGHQYTSAGDIWGLGVSICECLLGKFPFEKPESYFDYLDEALKGDLLDANADVSTDARDFVSLCAQVEPKDRPSANDLLKHPFVNRRADNAAFAGWLDEVKTLRKSMPAKRHR